jgi:NADPH:quinone reductase-like Zn-dependent oxidoreductase
MNLVFDTVSADTAEKSLTVLGKGGRLVSITLMEIPADLQAKADALEVSIDKLLVQSNGEDMKLLSSWLESGAIIPHVSQTFAFEKLGEAHTSIEAGRSVGKVIVTL